MDDRFRQLASECPLLIVITGDATQRRFEMAVLTGSLEDLAKREDFVALVGFDHVTPRIAFAVELDEAVEKALAQVFVRLMESAVGRVEHWLENDFKTPPVNRVEAN